ncbi:MAG: enoyl-CoA hydratase/isomerase family protein [Rhodospirillales bacterium]|nr:enoyl-CoA hydratase/isomerase family protein [Rhodospirillales bacterium]
MDSLLQQWDGDVLTLTLNRPDRGNALNAPTVEALLDALEGAKARVGAAVVLTGTGRNFCTGFDLADLETVSDGELLHRFARIEQLLQNLHHAPFPIVALVKGRNFGAGVDIVCACSDRIATPDARFRMPGWRFDLALGTRRLAARIGADRARAILRDAAEFSAQDARAWGLLTDLVDESAWPAAVRALIEKWNVMSAPARAHLLALTVRDTRDADMADLVRSAFRPGLRQRIADYRAKGVRRQNI